MITQAPRQVAPHIATLLGDVNMIGHRDSVASQVHTTFASSVAKVDQEKHPKEKWEDGTAPDSNRCFDPNAEVDFVFDANPRFQPNCVFDANTRS